MHVRALQESLVSCSGHRGGVSHPERLCACVLYCPVPLRHARQYFGVKRKELNKLGTQHQVKLDLSTCTLEPTP
jgi:hypothetical protein